MEKKRILLFPFFLGLLLMIYSWFLSFPLSIGAYGKSVFGSVPLMYWFGLPLLLTSTYMLATSSKSNYWKWAATIVCVMSLYSLFYFHYMLPSSDAQYFRGLTEYYIATKNLDPSQSIRGYFQWPSFFIQAGIITSISGIESTQYEFVLFAVIGFLLATALYVYVSRAHNRGGFLAVVTFFTVMFFWINYQAVPFSMALGLLFLLFMLETRKRSSSTIVIMLVLFSSISITHAFVPLFFVLYLLVRSIVSRDKQHLTLLILTSLVYFLVQFTLAQSAFASSVILAIFFPKEYASLAGVTFAPVSAPLDVMAQIFSRTVTILFALISFAGFIFLIVKRKIRDTDKAIFLAGSFYSGLGFVLYTLGSRAIPLLFIPVSIGAAYLYESKLGPYVKGIILILLCLIVFIPMHNSFGESTDVYQTRESRSTANFMIDKYDWNLDSVVVSDVGAKWYISPQIQGRTEIDTDFSSRFKEFNIEDYDCIIYSVGLLNSLQEGNISADKASQQILQRFNVIYNLGLSYVAKKSG